MYIYKLKTSPNYSTMPTQKLMLDKNHKVGRNLEYLIPEKKPTPKPHT